MNGEPIKPPPIVMELHIADASILLAELLRLTRQVPDLAETGSTERRLKHITSMLSDAMRRWPRQTTEPPSAPQPDYFGRFTTASTDVLSEALREALRKGSNYIEPEHIRSALDFSARMEIREITDTDE